MSRRGRRTIDGVRRILLLGSSGQVGREIASGWRVQPGTTLRAAARSHMDPALRFDLEAPESVADLLERERPDHVILVAAWTNVAGCEADPERSWRTNVLATRTIVSVARRHGCTVTFISTDYVFDGQAGPYLEAAEPRPINVYGAHKLAAEEAVLAASPLNLVIRSCQVFGSDPRRVNFVLRVADALRRGEIVTAASDLLGTPTYAPDLAQAIVDLTMQGASGIWHVAGETFLSRYALAVQAALAFGVATTRLIEVSTADMDDAVQRPRRAGLVDGRLLNARMDRITPLDRALAELAAQERRR